MHRIIFWLNRLGLGDDVMDSVSKTDEFLSLGILEWIHFSSLVTYRLFLERNSHIVFRSSSLVFIQLMADPLLRPIDLHRSMKMIRGPLLDWKSSTTDIRRKEKICK